MQRSLPYWEEQALQKRAAGTASEAVPGLPIGVIANRLRRTL